jgi:Arc-like DNA binding dprotein
MAPKIPRLAQTKIRLPTALRRDLQRAADKNKRPLNAEIIERLEASCRNEKIQEDQLAIAAAVGLGAHSIASGGHSIASGKSVDLDWDDLVAKARNAFAKQARKEKSK